MFSGKIIEFRQAVRKRGKEAFYKPVNENDFLEVSIKDKKFIIKISFSFMLIDNIYYNFETDDFFSFENINDYKVRIHVQEMKYNNDLSNYEAIKYGRSAYKQYELNNDLLEIISKIRPFVISQLKDIEYYNSEDNIFIDFTELDNFTVMEKPENYTDEQICAFLESIENMNIVSIGNSILLYKTLEGFKNELINVLSGTEHQITAVFKKYESILSIVLLGMESEATFEYTIDPEQYDVVVPDASMENQEKQIINLIECKRADAQMFNDSLYRNNTLKIKPDFYNAIHQTNIQRSMMALTADTYYKTLPKSILIYGNLEEEINRLVTYGHPVKQNLNTLRYNNKDVIILTYDELIEKIDLLINNSKLRNR